MPKIPQSSVIYRGPSLIDGAPIVALAIISDRNKKTGPMLQTYILRADIDPREASKTGADRSICGDCPHRGRATDKPEAKQAEGRSCYVLLGQGPLIAFKSFQRGLYPDLKTRAEIAALGAGRMVRVGTYGDPAAVPSRIWAALLSKAAGHTAYSHQANLAGAAFDAARMMQSVETEAEARAAWAQGRRTFRVVKWVSDIVKGQETLCPASKEGGRRTTCHECGLCAGSALKAKSIAIPAHGAGSVHFN